jgi:rhodanese-related sulfurtransferase
MSILSAARNWFDHARRTGGVLGSRPQSDAARAAQLAKYNETARKIIGESTLFGNLPEENADAMLARLETVPMASGTVVVREGTEGDYYYLLVDGSASVARIPGGKEKPEWVADLDKGSGFGEESLISNAKRNATITMKTDGVVMRLSKDDFNDHVKEPLITWTSPADAQRMVKNDKARWLDVRDQSEAGTTRLSGALAVPLTKLRESLADIDKDRTYVCYCQNGRQSSTAAFLLVQLGYKVSVLRGGLLGLERAGVL